MNKYVISEKFEHKNFRVFDVPDDPNKNIVNAIKLSTSHKTFLVIASDVSVKQEWLQAFEKTLENFKKSQSSFVKGGVIEETKKEFLAPEWQFDMESDSCTVCDAKFTFFLRRHHCRLCGKLACGNCSQYRRTIASMSDTPVRVCKECFLKQI